MRVPMNSNKSDIPNLIGVTRPSINYLINCILPTEIFYANTLTIIFTIIQIIHQPVSKSSSIILETKFQFFETAFVSSNKSSTEDLDEVTCLEGKSNNRLTR